MALTITKIGRELSTEKLTYKVVSDDVNTTSVIMKVILDPSGLVTAHEIEHLPDFGTTDTFTFEVNSILKDYFNFEFQPLSGSETSTIENVIFGLDFSEVFDNIVQPAISSTGGVIKNITQDVFEIETFDFTDYDCGDTGNSSRKLLTSGPSPLYIANNTSTFISVLTTSYTVLVANQEWVIETYDSAGALITSRTETVTVPPKAISGGYVGAGNYDIATLRVDMDTSSGAVQTRVYIRDIASPFTVRSETKVIKLKEVCEEAITLSWFNEFGVQDTYTFDGNITRVGIYKDSTYNKSRPVNPLSTNVGELVYKSSYNYQFEIFSNRIPQETLKWLARMLRNKQAAIQTERKQGDLNGLLYNWFTIDSGNGGDGTANGGIVNQSQTGWRVPSRLNGTDADLLRSFLNPDEGGKIKTTGFEYWNSPNTGATNATGFNAVGSGRRDVLGFSNIKQTFEFMTYENTANPSYPLGSFTRYFATFNGSGLGIGVQDAKAGTSIRLMRLAVAGENDGDFIPNAYTGNDGKVYDGVVIGTQVWINRSLYETKYNDGTSIAEFRGSDADWQNLSTGAFCVYDNAPLDPPTDGKYFPIVIDDNKVTDSNKFDKQTLFSVTFRMANERKGIV